MNALKRTLYKLQPILLLLTFFRESSTYRAKGIGDRAPPCLTPC